MTTDQARRILGVTEDMTKEEIKKAYRKKIVQVHPDTAGADGVGGSIDSETVARELNAAYAILVKGKAGDKSRRRKDHKQSPKWNTPIVEEAYTEREIYQYAEDPEGNVIGRFSLTEGKYLWDESQEEFELFLYSLMQAGDKILARSENETGRSPDERQRRKVQAELCYLLAQQFIDYENRFGKTNEPEEDLYVSAMLEISPFYQGGKRKLLQEGTSVYPYGFKGHKLYVKDAEGESIGYVSFAEDKMYYLIMPVLEAKKAKVKLEIAPFKQSRRKRRTDYVNLHLWVRFKEGSLNMPVRELSHKIGIYLATYAN